MKKTLRAIESLVPTEPNYGDIRKLLDFKNGGLSQRGTYKRGKRIPISVVVSAICASAVVIAMILGIKASQGQNASKRLTELNDYGILSLLSDLSDGNDQIPAWAPDLDVVWQNYLDYDETDAKRLPYFVESKLILDSEYVCYYLAKTTIEFIERRNSEEKLYYMTDELGNINYLRYFNKLYEERQLSDGDRVLTLREKADKPLIQSEINGCKLVKIVQNLNISDGNLGKSFLTSIRFDVSGADVALKQNAYIEQYGGRKILVRDVPYLTSFYESGLYPASLLNSLSYLVDEDKGTFETHICYNHSILEKNAHYYDSIEDIIIEKRFISEMIRYDKENNEQRCDYYEIVCDYDKAKILFNV